MSILYLINTLLRIINMTSKMQSENDRKKSDYYFDPDDP